MLSYFPFSISQNTYNCKFVNLTVFLFLIFKIDYPIELFFLFSAVFDLRTFSTWRRHINQLWHWAIQDSPPWCDDCAATWTERATIAYRADPPENCYLTVKKLPKTWHFFKKLPKIFFFFQKNCHLHFFEIGFFLKTSFWQFLIFKWKFSGGSGMNPFEHLEHINLSNLTQL